MSKLEHLPDELLLEILAYCNAEDLFISLLNLNMRFNNLVYTQRLSVDLTDVLRKYDLDQYYKSILYQARHQICSLRLSDRFGRMTKYLTNDNQISIDFETRKYILCQVKQLTLNNAKLTDINQILSCLTNIEQLRIEYIQDKQCTPRHSNEMLQSIFKKTSLKRLVLNISELIELENNRTGISRSLTHVTLNDCLMKDIPSLLRCIPNIEKLSIMCVNPSNRYSDDYEQFDFSIYDELADHVPRLTQMVLQLIGIAFDETECFLKQLPQLLKLRVRCFTGEDYSNGMNWERVITNYVPKLQELSIFIEETYISIYNLVDLNQITQSFNSLFWHRWPVVVEYYPETVNDKRLRVYTLPIQEEWLSTYLHGLQIRTNIAIHDWNNEKSYYKRVRNLTFIFHENSLSGDLLSKRMYSDLGGFTFSFESANCSSPSIDTIINDLQQVFSTSLLAKIENIYLNDENNPINFLSSLLNILPNVTSLQLPVSSLHLSNSLPLMKFLTVTIPSNIDNDLTYFLDQITNSLPNISWLYLQLENIDHIYIFLPHCLQRLFQLYYLEVSVKESSSCIDQQRFVSWFDDYKKLNELDDHIQVEFSHDNYEFFISL
ncbi:hypothetical protein I4U23_013628 [Adineta vaga]|nr:hypothetical protein I4U23_013628 [Adineta vaga]